MDRKQSVIKLQKLPIKGLYTQIIVSNIIIKIKKVSNTLKSIVFKKVLQYLMKKGQQVTEIMWKVDISNYLFQPVEEEEERKITTLRIENSPIKHYIENDKVRQKTDSLKGTKAKKKKDEEQVNENIKSGHWSVEENKKYHWFLQIYNSHFMNKHLRRMDKIFKTMSIFIGSRQAQQCRSHHQKMEKKHSSFVKIILSLRNQHYKSQHSLELEAQLAAHGLSSSNGLLTFDVLHQDEIKNHNCSKISEDEVQIQHKTIENQEKKEVDLIANLFQDEKYQNNLGFFWV